MSATSVPLSPDTVPELSFPVQTPVWLKLLQDFSRGILWPDSFFQHIILPVVGEITIVLGGITVMMVGLARMNGRSQPARFALIGLPLVLILSYAFWVINPGFDNYLTVPVTAVSPVLTLENPGLTGPYTVQRLTYGSCTNERRPEFGAEAVLITPVLDGTPIFAGYSGLTAAYFQWYWGFDFSHLPLNGTVWYPERLGRSRWFSLSTATMPRATTPTPAMVT